MIDDATDEANRSWLIALAVALIIAGPVLHYVFGAPRWVDALLLVLGASIAVRELTLKRRR